MDAFQESRASAVTALVLAEVQAERRRQDQKWGESNHEDGTSPDWGPLRDTVQARVDFLAQEDRSNWAFILLEEVYEALAETEAGPLRKELVHVAAVAVKWIEALDRRLGQTPTVGMSS